MNLDSGFRRNDGHRYSQHSFLNGQFTSGQRHPGECRRPGSSTPIRAHVRKKSGFRLFAGLTTLTPFRRPLVLHKSTIALSSRHPGEGRGPGHFWPQRSISTTWIPASAGMTGRTASPMSPRLIRTFGSGHNNVSYKSTHSGLAFSIRSSFHARFHSLIAFSRWIADSIESCGSYQTSLSTPYFLVNPCTT